MKGNSKQGEVKGGKNCWAVRKGCLSESVVLQFGWRLDSWEEASLRRCVGRALRSEAQSTQRPEDGSKFACVEAV